MCWTVSNNEANSAKISWLTDSMKLISPPSRQKTRGQQKGLQKMENPQECIAIYLQVLLLSHELSCVCVYHVMTGPLLYLDGWLLFHRGTILVTAHADPSGKVN